MRLPRPLVRTASPFEPDGATTRYFMLESLRQFAHQQIVKLDEIERARGAHLSYFVQFAEHANDHIRGPDEADQVRSIRTELANLRAAHQHALAVGDRHAAERLIAALHDYAEWRQLVELSAWARSTLELGSERAASESRGWCFFRAPGGNVYVLQQDGGSRDD